jgi:hypothetical protein
MSRRAVPSDRAEPPRFAFARLLGLRVITRSGSIATSTISAVPSRAPEGTIARGETDDGTDGRTSGLLIAGLGWAVRHRTHQTGDRERAYRLSLDGISLIVDLWGSRDGGTRAGPAAWSKVQ